MKNQPKQHEGVVIIKRYDKLGNEMTLQLGSVVYSFIPPFKCPIDEGICEFICTDVVEKKIMSFTHQYALGTLFFPDGRPAWYDGMILDKGVSISPSKYRVFVTFDRGRRITSVIEVIQ